MAGDPAELELVTGFMDSLAGRVSGRVVQWPGGVAYLDPALRKIWDVNFLDLRDGTLSAEVVAHHADRLLGKTGCEHRRVRITDATLGAALEPEFHELGWETDVHVVMASRRPPNRVVDTSMVEELGDATWPGREEQMRTYPFDNDDETMSQMRLFYRRAVDAGSGRDFAIVEDGKPISFALLYSDGMIGQIEDVATLEPYRNRGYSWRVVTKALQESKSRHDITFLIADDRDWPKDFYSKLGFDPITRHYYFLKRPRKEEGPADPGPSITRRSSI